MPPPVRDTTGPGAWVPVTFELNAARAPLSSREPATAAGEAAPSGQTLTPGGGLA